jgi:hypothetical protein
MPRGEKSRYTEKQERQAEHIADKRARVTVSSRSGVAAKTASLCRLNAAMLVTVAMPTKPFSNGPQVRPGTFGSSSRQASPYSANNVSCWRTNWGTSRCLKGSWASRTCTRMNSPRGSPCSSSQSAYTSRSMSSSGSLRMASKNVCRSLMGDLRRFPACA